MANALGISCELSGQYLSVQVEYGTETTLHPELVNSLLITLKNENDVLLREWSIDCASFENSDGIYRTGTILTSEEAPSYIMALAQVQGGTAQARAQVFQKKNQITTNHF